MGLAAVVAGEVAAGMGDGDGGDGAGDGAAAALAWQGLNASYLVDPHQRLSPVLALELLGPLTECGPFGVWRIVPAICLGAPGMGQVGVG